MMPSVIPFKVAGIGGLILAALLAAALWRADHLSGELDTERTAHKSTQEALAREVEKGMGWKIAYENALEAAKTHREATQACLDRAADAETARREREALLQAAQPRPRTAKEQTQVVEDETRKRAADRLNRPF